MQRQYFNCHYNLINSYIRKRAEFDPELDYVGEIDLTDLDDDCSYDILDGDAIMIQWKRYFRCDDSEYYSRIFPLSDLCDDRWMERLEREAREKEEAKKRKEEQRKKREAARSALAEKQKERAERAELARLQQKYGS